MNKKLIFVFVTLALLLAACGSRAVSQTAGVYEVAQSNQRGPSALGAGSGGSFDSGYAAMPTPAPLDQVHAAPPTVPDASNQALTQDRRVVMQADLTIVVADTQAETDAITHLAQNLGGYIISMQMYQTTLNTGDTVPEGTISLRVPSDKLEAALTQIKADAVEVRSEDRSGQDVTSQYVDLQSQLSNLQQAEQDLLGIMDDARNNPGNNTTTRTQDVLNVYNQIVSIRGQIEQIQGQIKYYDTVTATSLINVTLIPQETAQPIHIGPWSPKGALNQAVTDLVGFWHNFVEFLIRFVVYDLPVLVLTLGPLALIAWGVIALIKRNKGKKAKAG